MITFRLSEDVLGRTHSTRLMVSRPLRPLAKRMLFSKADAIELPVYPVPK